MGKTADERIAEAVEYLDNKYVEEGFVADLRAILAPEPKRHTFGGVVFEETGEVRDPMQGEWYRFCDIGDGAGCSSEVGPDLGARTILRPVRVEASDA